MTTRGKWEREHFRRLNKTLAMHLALWSWQKRIDCVKVRRSDLCRYLGFKNLQDVPTLSEFERDVKPFFPYVSSNKVFVFLSRHEHLGEDVQEAAIRPEKEMVRLLVLAANGLEDFCAA